MAMKAAGYRPEIDGLRALAVLAVMLFHAGLPGFSGGFFGVDVFFVISGFLITKGLVSDLEAGSLSLISFYERRIRRIFPALIFVTVCCVPFIWFLGLPVEINRFAQASLAIAFFCSNIFFQQTTAYFSPDNDLNPLIHTWSLGVEEQFYLFFPIAFAILCRYTKKKQVWILAFLALASFGLMVWWEYNGETLKAFYLTPARGWQLLVGALSAHVPVVKNKVLRQTGATIGLLLTLFSIFGYRDDSFLPLVSIMPTLGSALILIFASRDVLAGRVLSFRPMVSVGLISYSAYLFHQPVLAFARMYNLGPLSVLAGVVLTFFSLAMAFVSWKFVETPFRQPRRVPRKWIFSTAGGAVTVIAAFSFSMINNESIVRFFDPKGLVVLSTPDVMSAKCHSRIDVRMLQSGQACMHGNHSKLPAMALIGDSHAGALVPALEDYAIRNTHLFASFTRDWCVPFYKFNSRNKECRAYIDEAFLLIARAVSIKTVVLHAEWPAYIEGFRFGAKPFAFHDDESTVVSVAQNYDVFSRGLRRTIEFLQKAGKKIIILGSVPEHPFHVRDTLARSIFLGRPLGFRGATQEEFLARNEPVFEQFSRLSKDVQVVRFDSIFCPQARHSCQTVDLNGMPLYSDGNHLTFFGARHALEGVAINLFR